MKLESALIGYVLGLIVGSVFFILILYYLIMKGSESTYAPTNIVESQLFQDNIIKYYESNQNIFIVAFLFGFFSGLGGSGKAVNSKRK